MFLGQLLPHRRPLFPCRYHVVFAACFVKRVAIFTVEQTDPVRLLTEVLQDGVVFLGEDLDAYFGVAARESEL